MTDGTTSNTASCQALRAQFHRDFHVFQQQSSSQIAEVLAQSVSSTKQQIVAGLAHQLAATSETTLGRMAQMLSGVSRGFDQKV